MRMLLTLLVLIVLLAGMAVTVLGVRPTNGAAPQPQRVLAQRTYPANFDWETARK